MIKTKHYTKVHAYLGRKFGKASRCDNRDCQFKHPKRFEWALIKGREYSKNLTDYMQLCVSCHRKYDFTESQRSKMSAARAGREFIHLRGKGNPKSKPVIQCDLQGKEIKIWESINLCATTTGILKQGILNCLYGKMNQTKGFTFRWYNSQSPATIK